VLVDFSRLEHAEIEPLEGTAKEHGMVIKTNVEQEDGGQVFVFAAETAEELEQWINFLRLATVDAMPNVHLGEDFVEEMLQCAVKNRRLKIEATSTEDKKNYEPVWKSSLWKVGSNKDRMEEASWFSREVWLARNGSLVYWSHKEHRELVYYTPEDIQHAEIKLLPNASSFFPWAFQVCLAPANGVEFEPGEFAAESEEMRGRWAQEFERFRVLETF